MRVQKLQVLLWLMFSGLNLFAADVLLTNVRVSDGTGKPPFPADVRFHGDRITAIAKHLDPAPGETVQRSHQ
jgi:N-acyl-D-aspartate/D-glutamate deacylase